MRLIAAGALEHNESAEPPADHRHRRLCAGLDEALA
jgi:hypothetical protein